MSDLIITLYHFTSARRVLPIQRDGLTLGHVPVLLSGGRFGLNPGFQWLTTNPDWNQPWASRLLIKEDRSEVRFEVSIPASEIQYLLRWTDVQKRFGWTGKAAEQFNFSGEGENWILYQGNLPPEYLNKTTERPKHGNAATADLSATKADQPSSATGSPHQLPGDDCQASGGSDQVPDR